MEYGPNGQGRHKQAVEKIETASHPSLDTPLDAKVAAMQAVCLAIVRRNGCMQQPIGRLPGLA